FRYLLPGPKGLPFIGDVKHASDQAWLASPQRKDDYGELMYLSAFGQGILVVNSQRVAVDLLEKRSNIYSDRPRYISLSEFLTENLTFVFTGYGDLYAIVGAYVVLLIVGLPSPWHAGSPSGNGTHSTGSSKIR
ncbi:hypothetical protein EDB84DRAFT_1271008, partial [Lactarius hengduanensis]